MIQVSLVDTHLVTIEDQHLPSKGRAECLDRFGFTGTRRAVLKTGEMLVDR